MSPIGKLLIFLLPLFKSYKSILQGTLFRSGGFSVFGTSLYASERICSASARQISIFLLLVFMSNKSILNTNFCGSKGIFEFMTFYLGFEYICSASARPVRNLFVSGLWKLHERTYSKVSVGVETFWDFRLYPWHLSLNAVPLIGKLWVFVAGFLMLQDCIERKHTREQRLFRIWDFTSGLWAYLQCFRSANFKFVCCWYLRAAWAYWTQTYTGPAVFLYLGLFFLRLSIFAVASLGRF